MAKPIIKFTAVPFDLNGYKGYRPQLESQPGVYDKAIIEVEGVDLATAKVNLKLFSENGNLLAETDYEGQYVQHEILSPNKIAVKSIANPTREPESVWVMKNKSVFVNVILEDGTALTHKIVIENE